jgi:DNA ligase (NAD+)
MKIKGLGPKTIEKLAEEELLWDIYDVYTLTVEDLSPILGEKISTKLIQEIEASKTPSFGTFISAFSIPLVGATAGKKLESVVNDLEDLLELDSGSCKEAGLGNVVTTNLLNWISEYFCYTYFIYTKYINITSIKAINVPKKNLGTVVITGKFDKSRDAMSRELELMGFDVKSTISSKTNYLLCADLASASSKVKKAQSLGIKTITSIDELKAFAEK